MFTKLRIVVVVLLMVGASSLQGGEPGLKLLVGDGPTVQFVEQPRDVLKELGEYWLGLECSQPTPALAAQLDLPKNQGLVVENVVPDSPAAKAGIERYDVLLKANDSPLENVLGLIQVINKVKDGKLTIELVHAGKTKTVAATPAKRPPEARVFEHPAMPRDRADLERIEKWMKEMLPGGEGGRPLRFRFFHPGQILPPGAALPDTKAKVDVTVTEKADLADGYKVTITREGDKPAKVTITKDKETWEATEGDLSKLPEKVRPQVEQLLGRARMGTRMFNVPVPGPMHVEAWPAPPAEGQPKVFEGRLERRLEQMNRQIEELRKAMDELRGRKGHKQPAPEKENKGEKTGEQGEKV